MQQPFDYAVIQSNRFIFSEAKDLRNGWYASNELLREAVYISVGGFRLFSRLLQSTPKGETTSFRVSK